MKLLDLNGRWKFKAIDRHRTIPPDAAGLTRWMDGTVPGTVHTDLLENGKIPDPFVGLNELSVQWIDSVRWLYTREFRLTADLLGEDAIELVAQGLDTYADLRVNGRRVGSTANMFVEHRFNVKTFLRAGNNTIEILFDSPTVRSTSLERRHGKLDVALESPRVYVRKAQYSFGWDWGPKLTTSGIWRSIFLEGYSLARLADPQVKTISVNRQRAVVELTVAVQSLRRIGLSLHMSIVGKDASVKQTVSTVREKVRLRMKIPNPQLWWPNGYGGQPMYTAVFTLLHGRTELHGLEVPFAIRTVKLLREKDGQGESFVFVINGQKIFCKGADWIPSDSFVPRIPAAAYERLLLMAKDAHMNMIRVWGGGIYEQDIFYTTCDRLGLMVWQDFMFACAEYPHARWFLDRVEDEAEKVVKRLRNHPSIVLWCGNNECEWIYCTRNPGKTPNEMEGAELFREVLPGVCRRLDGTRPYWRSTPFGRGFPNSETNGNHHQWSVWSAWKDFKEYEKNQARFVTEFGFQSPANPATLRDVIPPGDRSPQSRVMEHHNKQVEGPERLFRFQAAHCRVDTQFDEFIYRAQLVQAEALKAAVEHWRRRKFRTAGSLFWQLNDCWPVSSWSVIDSALRPKAAYCYAKRFFAPLLVSFERTRTGAQVWVSNDLLEDVRGTLNVTLRSFTGEIIWRKSFRHRVPRNSSSVLLVLDPQVYSRLDPASHYLLAQFVVHGDLVSENRLFFDEPKHLRLPSSKISMRLTRGQVFVLRSSVFVKDVRLDIEGADPIFDDNHFDMDAGVEKKVRLLSVLPAKKLRKQLAIWHLS